MRAVTAFALASLAMLSSQPAEARALDHLLSTDDIGLNKIPHQGTSNILVIPVHVGEGGFPAGQLADLQAQFNPDGGSFRTYWQTTSAGRYDPVPTVVAPLEYPDRCPLPGKTVATCNVTFQDVQLITSGGLRTAFEDMLGRLRDEQQLDLSSFDINGADGQADGHFDGVIVVSNIADGVAPPLDAIFNGTTVADGGGGMITLGVVAMAPPVHHEFAHMFGLIDLYGGPPVNGLMSESSNAISAFTRQQLGWGDVVEVTAPMEIELPPVLDGAPRILRVAAPGGGPRYVLLENRSGEHHGDFETGTPGLYLYSVDEETLADGPLHFLDLVSGQLRLPNAEAPYMNVALPVGCDLAGGPNGCALTGVGASRTISHADAGDTGFTVTIVDEAPDGTLTVALSDGSEVPAPGDGEDAGLSASGGCQLGADTDAGWWLLLPLLIRRRRAA